MKSSASRGALARARLGSSFVAMLGSAGVLAAILRNAALTTMISAIVTAIATTVNLFINYYEEQFGGQGSVTQIRDTLLEQVRSLAEVKGKMALAAAGYSDDCVMSAMITLNKVAAQLEMARARLGLSLGRQTQRND
jgi:hypothetical protein